MHRRRHRHPVSLTRPLAAWLFVAALATACGASSTNTDVESPPVGEPIVIDVDFVLRTGDQVETLSAAELFERAKAELKRKDHVACAAHFDMLWRDLPCTDFELPSLYNAGLCHEKLGDLETAALRYLGVIELDDLGEDGIDAHMKLAEVDANLANWARVVDHMLRVLEAPELKHLVKVEARYRAGMGMVALARYDEADTMFKTALGENRMADRATLPGHHYFVSGCMYGQALVHHHKMNAIEFRLPESRMQADMERKIELGREAHKHYERTVRQKNHYWAILSGYMVAKMYEDFYFDVLSSEIPHDLTERETREYLSELRAELEPLLEQAVYWYDKTAATASRIRHESEWVEETRARLARLQSYMEDDSLQRAEEDAIMEWNRQLSELTKARADASADRPDLEHDATVEFPPAPELLDEARAAAPQREVAENEDE